MFKRLRVNNLKITLWVLISCMVTFLTIKIVHSYVDFFLLLLFLLGNLV